MPYTFDILKSCDCVTEKKYHDIAHPVCVTDIVADNDKVF